MTTQDNRNEPDSPDSAPPGSAGDIVEDWPVTDAGSGGEVVLSIVIRVREGREEEFDIFLRGIRKAAEQFPGYRGSRVFRPVRGNRSYRIVLRFDSDASLQRWLGSEERRLWQELAEELTEAPPRGSNITGTAQASPLALALTPLEHYVRTSVSGIGLLLLGTGLALVMANSPLADSYEGFWSTSLAIGTERFGITESLRHWVNDFLMALFFFIVGLEIKREVLVGELRHLRLAALPVAAAVGGAVVPALLFLALNLGGDGARGWGIPMGTDTAFSLGIISLLGSRVWPMLLVFLAAFAIIDDILEIGRAHV